MKARSPATAALRPGIADLEASLAPAGSRLAPPRRSAYAEPEGDNAEADNEGSAQSTAQLAQAVHQNKSAAIHGKQGSMQCNHQPGKALHLRYMTDLQVFWLMKMRSQWVTAASARYAEGLLVMCWLLLSAPVTHCKPMPCLISQ